MLSVVTSFRNSVSIAAIFSLASSRNAVSDESWVRSSKMNVCENIAWNLRPAGELVNGFQAMDTLFFMSPGGML